MCVLLGSMDSGKGFLCILGFFSKKVIMFMGVFDYILVKWDGYYNYI